MQKNSRTLFCVLALWLFCTVTAFTQAHTVNEEMSTAANRLLAALTPEQKAKATFPLKDEERSNWYFVPKVRKGITLKEMTQGQQMLAMGLLSSGLSQRGFGKATSIISLEEVLAAIEKNGPVRDSSLYYISIFGQPGTNENWGWRVEGHHLSLNFTVAKNSEISATPSFFGSNPGEVRVGPRQGMRVLGAEEDLARDLVKSFTDDQKKIAIISTNAPKEVITGNSRKVKMLEITGLSVEQMTETQRTLLAKLGHEYLNWHRPEMAEADLKKIKQAGLEKVHFAWAGGIEPGQPHYYRIQGPTFLMEYDNTQNDANHVHTVWRDFENDFGEDILREHYEQTPHSK